MKFGERNFRTQPLFQPPPGQVRSSECSASISSVARQQSRSSSVLLASTGERSRARHMLSLPLSAQDPSSFQFLACGVLKSTVSTIYHARVKEDSDRRDCLQLPFRDSSPMFLLLGRSALTWHASCSLSYHKALASPDLPG